MPFGSRPGYGPGMNDGDEVLPVRARASRTAAFEQHVQHLAQLQAENERERPWPWPDPPSVEEIEAAMEVLATAMPADALRGRLQHWHDWESRRLNYGWGPQRHDWLDQQVSRS